VAFRKNTGEKLSLAIALSARSKSIFDRA